MGGIRTALFSYLYAKQHGGQFLLRIEDTDKEREVPGSLEHIMESLEWLGIRWDEGPRMGGPFASYIQSERLDLYMRYASLLMDRGLAYADPYTKEELGVLRTKAEEEKRPFLFRDHRPDHHAVTWTPGAGVPLRFRVPEIKRYMWHDEVRGELTAGEEALDDFILIKGDGYPTYNFCHVVDDIEMKITHVMRGQEFISSTPKFLSLYEALGVVPPKFVTLPPILGEGGQKKLGKRDGAKDILEYRAEGYMPETMVNFLALLGWNPGTPEEFFSMEQLVQSFSLERIQKSGAQFNDEKLLDLNQRWMRSLSDQVFVGYLSGLPEGLNADILHKAIPVLKERAQTFGEARTMLTEEMTYLFESPTLSQEQLRAKEAGEGSTAQHLTAILELLVVLPEALSAEDAKAALMPYADAVPKEQGGRGAALWPLRYALSGAERSPDPFMLIHILGVHEAMARIRGSLSIL